MKPTYFARAADFRAWLADNHDKAPELLVGLHKKGAGRATMTYSEAVDEALCFGWIDGVRRTVDEERWTIRFTPRKPKSIWSQINLRRIEVLMERGHVMPPGKKAYETRDPAKQNLYSFEQKTVRDFTPEEEKRFRANAKAWAYFEAQPPGYRRVARFWVVSAKKEETQASRLDRLIADSANGKRLDNLTPPALVRKRKEEEAKAAEAEKAKAGEKTKQVQKASGKKVKA
jgi:uncharacterized protein YdeI (YjbR/CyaY-like superfamily)